MKKAILVSLLISLILTLSACQVDKDKERTEKVIEDMMKQSNFEYDLLTEMSEDLKQEFTIVEGFGEATLIPQELDLEDYNNDMYAYMNNEEVTYYTVSGYPDVLNSDGTFITRIFTTDQSISLYDLSVGNQFTQSEVEEHLEEFGFLPHEEIYSTYQNERARIRVYIEEGVIVKIGVEVEITNEEGIIF